MPAKGATQLTWAVRDVLACAVCCSKKGTSWLDVMVPAGMGAAGLGSSPCCGSSPQQPWHCLILIKGWMVPELQKCSAHSVACPCP